MPHLIARATPLGLRFSVSAFTAVFVVALSAGLSAQEAFRENLGPNINTEHNESAPVITPNGDILYFWSMGRPGSPGFQDIYQSFQDAGGILRDRFLTSGDSTGSRLDSLNRVSFGWTPSELVDGALNNAEPNIVLSITPDGNQLLLYNKAPKPELSDLAVASKGMGSWQSPKNLKIENFQNPGGSGLTAFLCPDGKTLILSLRLNGHDDLFLSRKKEDGSFSEPRRMGGGLNTPKDEITPFLAPDMLTLYFSSDGHGGKGGLDVFMARRLDDTWEHWSPVVALSSINSPADDYYFKFPLNAEYAYFASSGTDSRGGRDIYRAKLPPQFKPQPVFQVEGKVLNKTNKAPMAASVTYISLKTGQEVGTATTDPKDGSFKILLPAGERYAILAEGEGYVAMSESLDGTTAKDHELRLVTLYLLPLDSGQTFRLNNVYFGSGSVVLEKESFNELNRIARMLNDNPTVRIEIGGHTDSYGEEQANKYFSTKRAEAVRDYLLQQGIAAERLTAVGYGPSKPVADNRTAEGMKLNRRVEITILKGSTAQAD